MDILLRDVAHAVSGLLENLGFATVATITIALGIGACTAIFSVVNAVLLRPLPYADASRLVIVWGELRARNVKDWTFSPPDFRDLQLQSSATFDDLAATFGAGRTPISERGGEPEQIRVAGVTTNFFRLLGARIIVGRDDIDADATPEAQAPPGQPPPARLPQIAILSYGFIPAVRAAVAAVDPRAPLAEAQPMTALVDKAMAPIRFVTTPSRGSLCSHGDVRSFERPG